MRKIKAEIRADGLHITGYVNVPGRESRPVVTPRGKVIEIISQGAFDKAIKKAGKIDLLVDHERKIASTSEDNLKVREDAVGLRAEAIIADEEIITAARAGKLKGWSFNMMDVVDSIEERAGQLPIRRVNEFSMSEITLAVNKMPVYSSTSIEIRAKQDTEVEERAILNEVEVIDRTEKEIDYTSYEQRIAKLKEEE